MFLSFYQTNSYFWPGLFPEMLKLTFLTTFLSAMLKLTFLTTPPSRNADIDFLTTPLLSHADTDFIDHASYSPPKSGATGLRRIQILFFVCFSCCTIKALREGALNVHLLTKQAPKMQSTQSTQ
jgi:hypothetical protein